MITNNRIELHKIAVKQVLIDNSINAILYLEDDVAIFVIHYQETLPTKWYFEQYSFSEHLFGIGISIYGQHQFYIDI